MKMKLGVVISMYDEHDMVLSSMQEIKRKFPDVVFSVVQSDDGAEERDALRSIRKEATHYERLPDLSKQYSQHEFPARCICRNFAAGFKNIYADDFDLIIAFVGDTYVIDAESFRRRYDDMKKNGWIAMVSKLINANMHQEGAGGELIPFSRTVISGDVDFTCSLFMVDGKFAKDSQLFTNIKILNKYCSELCLGKELQDKLTKPWDDVVGILNENKGAYDYNDGIVYHALHGGPAARWEKP